MEEIEKDTLLFLDELNEWEREERCWGGRGKDISTPSPNSHLSRGSASF